MTRPAIGKARRLAVEHITAALRSKLADAIATARSESSTPTLHLPAPASEAIIANDPDAPEKVARNHSVSAFVWPGGPRRPLDTGSGGPSTYRVHTEFELEVVLVFTAHVPQTIDDADGVEMSIEAQMRRRAELYCEALITTVMTYACKTGVIDSVMIANDEAPVIYLEERNGGVGILGVAGASFTLKQICDAPQRHPLT